MPLPRWWTLVWTLRPFWHLDSWRSKYRKPCLLRCFKPQRNMAKCLHSAHTENGSARQKPCLHFRLVPWQRKRQRPEPLRHRKLDTRLWFYTPCALRRLCAPEDSSGRLYIRKPWLWKRTDRFNKPNVPKNWTYKGICKKRKRLQANNHVRIQPRHGQRQWKPCRLLESHWKHTWPTGWFYLGLGRPGHCSLCKRRHKILEIRRRLWRQPYWFWFLP